MKIGSIVETVRNFENLRDTWRFPYPKKGDVLTVSEIEEHCNPEARSKGIVLLYFEELPSLIGVCDRRIDGKANFVELLLPDEIQEILNSEPINQKQDEKSK